MVSSEPLLETLTERLPDLPRNQRAVARYVLANYQSAAFATITELAEQARVSTATVVRFAKAFGYSGYPDLQRDIRSRVRADLKGTQRFERTYAATADADSPLTPVIAKEQENIAALQAAFDADAFARAVAALTGATEIMVVGSRSTAALAAQFCFGLNKIGRNADAVLDVTTTTREAVARLPARALLVTIGFPRYLRELVELNDSARARGIATLTVTDGPLSPLQGDVSLYAPAESISFMALQAAPLILLNTLLNEIALADKAGTLAALKRFDAFADRAGIFHNGPASGDKS